MAKKNSEDVKAERSKRAQDETEHREEAQEKVREARQIRREAQDEQVKAARDRQIDLAEAAEDDDEDRPKPKMLDGKPGSGSGLKPGDWFAPKSNPGAAAQVPTRPLQPESLQSHGKGIIYDKDLDNPPYGDDDPEAVDASPSGSRPSAVDKDAELKKANKATSRFKQNDPDNPTVGARGKDATASPNPIGSGTGRRPAGGSDSGDEA